MLHSLLRIQRVGMLLLYRLCAPPTVETGIPRSNKRLLFQDDLKPAGLKEILQWMTPSSLMVLIEDRVYKISGLISRKLQRKQTQESGRPSVTPGMTSSWACHDLERRRLAPDVKPE